MSSYPNIRYKLIRIVAGTLTILSFQQAAVVAQVAYQPAASAPNPAGPQAPAATIVYEPGDVYLPGSRVYALVGKTGFGHEHGVVGQLKQGRLRLNAAQDAGELVFDMTSFAADTDAARQYVGLSGTTDASTQQQVDANMLGSAVLDTARYPTASFTVRSITRLPQPSAHGLPQYQLLGEFTLHGVRQPIQVVAEAEDRQGWMRLRGGFTLLQSQFGITPFTKVFGAVGVADQLHVYGELWVANQRQVVAAANPGR